MKKRYLNILLISILLNIENNIKKYKDMKLRRNLKQPKVGEHYFIASNDYQKTKIKKEVIVTSVGRKYFTVKLVNGIDELKFSKADFSHNNGEYPSAYVLYNDVDDYEKKTAVKSFTREIGQNIRLLDYLSDDELISLYKTIMERKDLYSKNKDTEFVELKF